MRQPVTPLDSARRKAFLRLLPLLFLSFVIAYVDRTNVAVAKLTMTKDLPGFDNAVIGLGAGVFFLGYFLLEIPGTLLVERWSARKWLASRRYEPSRSSIGSCRAENHWRPTRIAGARPRNCGLLETARGLKSSSPLGVSSTALSRREWRSTVYSMDGEALRTSYWSEFFTPDPSAPTPSG